MSAPTYNTPTTSRVEPLKVVAAILQHEMTLEDDQIVTGGQKFDIPSNGPLVVVSYQGPDKPISSQSYFDSTLGQEVQQLVTQHMVRIEIMSLAPDNSARIRKEEIPLALRSFYSRKQQESNLVGIAWISEGGVDASSVEETAMLGRWVYTALVDALHQKTKPADSLTGFQIQLDVEAPASQAEIDPTKAVFH